MGAGRGGGGVDARDGRGDDARESFWAAGVEGAMSSRGASGGGSRRCMRLEKKPEIRFDARCCFSQRALGRTMDRGYLHPAATGGGFFDPAKRQP